MSESKFPHADIEVEVLRDDCWQNCEDFEPELRFETYTDKFNYYRRYGCKNLNRCRRLLGYLAIMKENEE